jgi:hypothetical protein
MLDTPARLPPWRPSPLPLRESDSAGARRPYARVGRTAAAPGRRPLAAASSAIASVSTTPHAHRSHRGKDLRRARDPPASAVPRPCESGSIKGPLESVLLLLLLLATSATAACLGGATTRLVAVSWRTARADPHNQAVGIVRLRAARTRLRQVAIHADGRADRSPGGQRRAARRRRPACRRHEDAQGRQPGTAAHRLRRRARPAGRDRVAVEVRRRRQDRRRALRPRPRGHRRRAVRHAPGRAREPADAGHPLELAQGPGCPRRCASSPASTCPHR